MNCSVLEHIPFRSIIKLTKSPSPHQLHLVNERFHGTGARAHFRHSVQPFLRNFTLIVSKSNLNDAYTNSKHVYFWVTNDGKNFVKEGRHKLGKYRHVTRKLLKNLQNKNMQINFQEFLIFEAISIKTLNKPESPKQMVRQASPRH